MRRVAPVVLVAVASLAACAQLGALFGIRPQPAATASEDPQVAEQRRQQEEQRRAAAAAEAERREQALLVELDQLRTDMSAGTGDGSTLAIAFAGRVRALAGAPSGKVDLAALTREAAGYLDAALQQAPSFELLRALADLPRGPETDAAFLRACPPLRPRVAPEYALGFVADCLDRAGGDAARLQWPGAAADVEALRRHQAEELRLAREAEAQRIAAEQERAREQAARVALAERYVAAAVFAAGPCSFSNCGQEGWSVDTAGGTVRVRCNFGNCLTDGWVADFPDHTSARTSCNFGDCFKDGWRTDLPDGQTATTRCHFGDCPKDGWTTEIPGLGSADTRCNFQDCLTDGWVTDLPTGGQVRCRCNFSDCRTNGATCN